MKITYEGVRAIKAPAVNLSHSFGGRSRIEKGGEKMQNLIRYLRDQQGVETLEWILIGGLITGVGIVLYPGVLLAGLTGVLGTIVAAITGAMP
jgi:Flp pilus assembly pilin Flp